jgi:hypothetical protein
MLLLVLRKLFFPTRPTCPPIYVLQQLSEEVQYELGQAHIGPTLKVVVKHRHRNIDIPYIEWQVGQAGKNNFYF